MISECWSGTAGPERVVSPRNKRVIHRIALVLVALATAPFAFIGSEPAAWLGLPIWLWSSIAFTVLLSILTAWGMLYAWPDEDDE